MGERQLLVPQREAVSARLATLGWRCNGKMPDGPEVEAYTRMYRRVGERFPQTARFIYLDASRLEHRRYFGQPIPTPGNPVREATR